MNGSATGYGVCFEMKITEMRREFDGTALRRGSMPAEPLTQFEKWFSDAAGKGAASPLLRGKMRLYRAFQILSGKAETIDANAMTLATATRDGQPSARTVLLKEVDDRGFIFFTNYESRKGRELEENPRAALTFFWPSFARQVCVTGTVSKISRVESEKYFNSRPRGSRVGALASNQSAIVENRHELEKRFEELGHEFERGEIPTPSYWGGYALAPESIEFWQGQPSRLHDRIRYTKERGGHWKIERLAP